MTRFGNVYGEGDINFSRIIPGIMKSIIKGEILYVRSDGKFVRDYVYVGDIINSLILLGKNINKIKGEAFNISSNENLSVIQVIKKVSDMLDIKILYRIMDNTVNEIPVQSINYRKIKTQLGWKPKYDFSTTIGNIYNWYKDYFAV